ncbi:hypothetical protein AQUCO_02000350v1 [Aquilegia coerulea]|uniref:KIB1-4 beta-propeller domain-containing protein n=1 Tax=Aquilegia coerulea TaxID=218851 RepID=A0A2G5DHY5_AQUCA|nr:hypothetical protein AQUCO_02000350v1 [Aquilegia coerulea]
MTNFSLQLPNDIIDIFGEKLNCIEDFISFGCVCKSWHQSFTRIKKKHVPFSPWLMLAYDENLPNIQTFFSFSSKKILNLPLPKPLIQDRRCLGSPFGWLVTIGLDLQIHLLNPLSQIQIPLPSQTTFSHQYKCSMEPEDLRRMFVFKFVLSSTPSEETSCVVMAIYSRFCKLAFAKPGDETWTSIESSRQDYTDAIFFQGQFYAVNSEAVLEICDINTPSPKAIKFASPPDGVSVDCGNRYYLVEMSGDLLLVERHIVGNGNDSAHEFHYYTFASQVYKLNFEKKSWTELSDLGDNALFIGTNTSYAIAISTSNYPEFRCNCIYFTDDHLELYCDNSLCDMGLFDLTDETEDEEEDVETVEPIYTGDNMISTFSRPLFIMPSF